MDSSGAEIDDELGEMFAMVAQACFELRRNGEIAECVVVHGSTFRTTRGMVRGGCGPWARHWHHYKLPGVCGC
jgi:hypothetical protein